MTIEGRRNAAGWNSAVAAPAAFPNMGEFYVLDTCPTDDLTREAIQGVSMFV